MDNFGSYGTNSAYMLNGLYAAIGEFGSNAALVADPDPSGTGQIVLRASLSPSGTAQSTRKVLDTPRATVGVALRLWMASLPSNSSQSAVPITLCDGSNNVLCSLWITTTGAIDILRNGTTTGAAIIASSTGPVLIANAWQHIEMKATISTTVGQVEVRVDGVVVIATAANVNTGGDVNCAQVRQTSDRDGSSGGITWYIKDYVIWDTTGSHNTDFLGSVSVYRLVPNSDVSLGGWTTSSGSTGYNLIDESPPVDTGYVQADDSPPAECEFGLTNLPVDVTSVRGLMTLVRAQKTDGGDAQLQAKIHSGASYANGADRPITTAFTYWYDVQEEDPDTTAPWLPSAVDAATLVLDRTV